MAFCSTYEKKKDFKGQTFMIGRYKMQNGEEVTVDPSFKNIGNVLENMDKLKVKDDDIILISYPKAGTHWMYEILSMLKKGQAEPSEKFKIADFIDMSSSITMLNGKKDLKILNTHLRPKYLPPDLLSKNKIVHVARNPKSIAVSYYFHTLNIKTYEYEGTFQGFLPTFIKGFHSIDGSWFEFMQEWWDMAQKQTNIYMVLYEDLKKDPVKEIAEVSRFLGYDYPMKFLQQVANVASFETMKTGAGKDEDFMRDVALFFKDGKYGMLRKGSIDDWKNYFTVADNEMFDAVYEEKMKNYTILKSRIRFE